MTGIVILNGASNYDERGASFFFDLMSVVHLMPVVYGYDDEVAWCF
jgi:hypothetical protein